MASSLVANGWQVECKEVRQRVAQLFAMRHWADCWFAVGRGRARRAAHRLILAAASPVLADMMYGERAQFETIEVPDVEVVVFDVMLEYIYTDEVKIDSCRVAQGVYHEAHKYALPHLQELCASYLKTNLDPASACRSYELAEQVAELELRDACLQMMMNRTSEVLEAGSLLEAQEATVARLFALEPLHIESELELLAAAERWARAATEHTAPPTKGTSQLPLRSAVQNIRFLTLTSQQFWKYSYPSPKLLLTDNEIMAIHMNISTTDAPLPMPTGFSTCRTSRMTKVMSPTSSTAARIVPNSSKQLTKDNENVRNLATKPFNSGVQDKYRKEATIQVVLNFYDPQDIRIFNSSIFYMGGIPWRICVARHNSLISYTIQCNWKDRTEWSCQAEVEHKVLSHKPPRYRNSVHVFSGSANSKAWDLGKAIQCLQDGKLIFEVSLKIKSCYKPGMPFVPVSTY